MPDQNHVSYPVLILACVASVVASVIFLDRSGKLLHSEDKEVFALSSYQVILMDGQAKATYRLSPKPSGQTATCHSGYLFIAADENPAMQGLLADYKNRGVKCESGMASIIHDPTPTLPLPGGGREGVEPSAESMP
jgi:hypothetical protein